jgi:hypothetical protein
MITVRSTGGPNEAAGLADMWASPMNMRLHQVLMPGWPAAFDGHAGQEVGSSVGLDVQLRGEIAGLLQSRGDADDQVGVVGDEVEVAGRTRSWTGWRL